jgi:hypothetical protein
MLEVELLNNVKNEWTERSKVLSEVQEYAENTSVSTEDVMRLLNVLVDGLSKQVF